MGWGGRGGPTAFLCYRGMELSCKFAQKKQTRACLKSELRKLAVIRCSPSDSFQFVSALVIGCERTAVSTTGRGQCTPLMHLLLLPPSPQCATETKLKFPDGGKPRSVSSLPKPVPLSQLRRVSDTLCCRCCPV